jgi:quercetin dioxygenase-like cupin family protein
VLSGQIEVEAGDAGARLKTGETARYPVDRPHAIRNAGRTVATALLVVLHAA